MILSLSIPNSLYETCMQRIMVDVFIMPKHVQDLTRAPEYNY